MPKGMTIRRPQPLEMHATMIEVPEGADLLEWLTQCATDSGYLPLIILSGMGILSRAVLRVPNDDALPEILDSDAPFGVRVDRDGTGFPELKDLPIAMVPMNLPIPEPEAPDPLAGHPLPHWSSEQTFDTPLTLIYSHGGRYRESSKPNMHLILSGSDTRSTGISETFVGEILPGCIAMKPLQFVVGIKPTLSNATVQGWTITVEPGYDVVEKLDVFLKARQNVGKCFILSATGKFSEAELVNLTESGGEETFQMPVDNGPYNIEGMSGILGNYDDITIHAAVVHNCGDPPCDSAGGRLTRGIVSSEGALDLYIGEMTEERDIHEA